MRKILPKKILFEKPIQQICIVFKVLKIKLFKLLIPRNSKIDERNTL